VQISLRREKAMEILKWRWTSGKNQPSAHRAHLWAISGLLSVAGAFLALPAWAQAQRNRPSGTTLATEPVQETLFTTQTPVKLHQSDGPSKNYELGTQFQSDTTGEIIAIRFWKDAAEAGSHVGRIWSGSGQLLASATFAGETPSGWQQQRLDVPVVINAHTTYVVSVNTAGSYYVASPGELAPRVVNGDLRAVRGDNGVFGPAGQFPTNSHAHTNYYRDVVFVSLADIRLVDIRVSSTRLPGGGTLNAWAELTAPAPPGGAEVTLESENAAVTVPQSVIVPAGGTEAEFTMRTSPVSVQTVVNVAGFYKQRKATTLTLEPPVLNSIAVNPQSVAAGGTAAGTVTLNGPAPAGGVTVLLLSDNPAAR
jgi:hypothetical protein